MRRWATLEDDEEEDAKPAVSRGKRKKGAVSALAADSATPAASKKRRSSMSTGTADGKRRVQWADAEGTPDAGFSIGGARGQQVLIISYLPCREDRGKVKIMTQTSVIPRLMWRHPQIHSVSQIYGNKSPRNPESWAHIKYC